MKIREAIACLACPRQFDCDSPPTLNNRPKHARCKEQLDKVNQLFAIREDGCRLAIVKEKGELPEKPFLWDRESTDYHAGYYCCEARMLKAHYVQEEVDEQRTSGS